MTREEMEQLLEEVDLQRDLLRKELEEIDALRIEVEHGMKGNGASSEGQGGIDEKEPSEAKSGEDFGLPESDDPQADFGNPNDVMAATKDILRSAIESGSLKEILEKIAGAMDFTKAAVNTFAQVVEKAQDKMEGKVESLPGPLGLPIMTDMWLPMMLNIIQTQEFQHLMANMIVGMVK